MGVKYKCVKILSAVEVEEKMELGLCFLCDEPFTLEHQLLHKNIQISVMDVDEEMEPDCESLPQQKMNFSSDDGVVQDEESLQFVLDHRSSNTLPHKSLFPTHSTPLFTDSSKFDDDVKEKSQIHNQARDSDIYTPKIDVVSVVHNHAVTKSLNSTLVNQQHSTISSPMPLSVQLPKCISISPCNFSVGLSVFTQNHSSPFNLQRLSGVKLKCFDPGGMIPLLFLPISSVFISVQFPSRVSLSIHPEPPDWVVVQPSPFKLSLCVTTEGIATTQYLDMHYFQVLLIFLQVFDQMSQCLVVCWDAIFSSSIDYEFVSVSLDLSNGLQKVNIKLVKCTFTNMLHWRYVKFCVYGRHINNVVIIRRLLVGIYMVNSLATKCFNHICVLVAYEEFEVKHALHMYDSPNYIIVSIVSMGWLQDGLVVFRDMYWVSFFPIEASCDSILKLAIHNSYDSITGRGQLLANYYDELIKLVSALDGFHTPLFFESSNGRSRTLLLTRIITYKEWMKIATFAYLDEQIIVELLKCSKEIRFCEVVVAALLPRRHESQYPLGVTLIIELEIQIMFSYCKFGLLFLHVEIKNGSLRNIQPILVVDFGSLTSQNLTKKLNTFNIVFAARNILVLEESNETHGAIIVENAKALVNCVSLVLYGALMSYKIEFSNIVEIELVHVLIALDIVWKMMSNSIYGNVFKLTSEVYLVALKCYVSMRCNSKIGFVMVGESVASALGLFLFFLNG